MTKMLIHTNIHHSLHCENLRGGSGLIYREAYSSERTVTQRMVEFLSKFQGRCIKIDRVNSIRVDKSKLFFNILRVVAR